MKEKINLTEVIAKTELDYSTDNSPNAGILVYALQNLGYDNATAICDIIDNSIDAGASEIKLNIDKNEAGQLRIAIIDNGRGMTKAVLDEALKLGSDTGHDDISDLGKFGMGLSTAGLSLANITTVLTKTADCDIIYKSVTNVHKIKETNSFIKYLGEASKEEQDYFNVNVNNCSGTIVIFEDCNGVKYKNKGDNCKPFANSLIKFIARTFRKFMPAIKFFVNNEELIPADPMMLARNEEFNLNPSITYYDEDCTITWYNENRESQTGIVHIKLVELPDTSKEVASELGINPINQGFSVLRNNREILYGYAPRGWKNLGTRHPSVNRIRGEISFDSSLDEAFGVNFTKNGIDMQDSVNDCLRAIIEPQVASIKKLIEKEKIDEKSDEIDHASAASLINKKSKTLITPPVVKEKRESPQKESEKIEKVEKEEKKLRTPIKTQLAKANVEFRKAHFSASGPIYEAGMLGKTITIDWNIDHPFYSRFILENKDNKNLVDSIDFFIYCLANAQIIAMGDDPDKAIMMESIISTMSSNMKALLS